MIVALICVNVAVILCTISMLVKTGACEKDIQLNSHRIKSLEAEMLELKEALDARDAQLQRAIEEVREKLNEYVDAPVDPEYAKGLENIMNYSLDQAKGKNK